jgi:hypothetical protein
LHFPGFIIFHIESITTEHQLAPSKAELQLDLLEEEWTSSKIKGSTTLLAQGLKIEESQ